ncbi:MAG: Arm DNA-binding domain-containing protein, partial [Chloroflexota bacterium]|nr:Arm DNA-binding domain-containing protein [Chloroflexota bacterium]
MAIRKVTLPSGTTKYEAVTDGPRDGTTGKRKQVRRRFDTRKQAVAWEASAKSEIDKGTFVVRERVTLDAYLDDWLGGLFKPKPSTVANYRDALKPVRRVIGAKMLQEIVKADVERVVRGMQDGSLRVQGRRGEPMSPPAIRLTLTVLSMALKGAVVEGRIARNVAAMVERPADTRKRRDIWEAADAANFLVVADVDRLAGAWRLSLHGLRRGEVLGLAWADVDLDQGLVHVHRSRVLVDGQPTLQASTKSDAGERMVPLDAGSVAAMRKTSAQQAQERLAAGSAYADTGLVAVDPLGRPVAPRWYGDRFRAMAKL